MEDTCRYGCQKSQFKIIIVSTGINLTPCTCVYSVPSWTMYIRRTHCSNNEEVKDFAAVPPRMGIPILACFDTHLKREEGREGKGGREKRE